MLNQELVKEVKNLIKNGTSYHVSELDNIYHKDLRIARKDPEAELQVMDKEQNMAFFKAKKEEGAAPLSPVADFLYAHASGPVGHVVLERRMKLKDKEEHLLYNIVLRKTGQRWKVVSEFVIPLN